MKNKHECSDMPITYCKECGKFYVLDKEGDREQILIRTDEGEEE